MPSHADMQLMGLPGQQLAQIPPPRPQALSAVPGWQAPSLQQPVQTAGPQPQVPLERHCLPVPQELPVPHWQLPVEQLLATTGSQVPQVTPPVPHAMTSVPGMQTLLRQHPLGHDVPSQMHEAPLQRSPGPQLWPPSHEQPPAELHPSLAGHVTQLPPLGPHWAGVLVVKHVPFEQQPLAQLCALQPAHMPPAQDWNPQF
jgi:hypothetical protein